MKYLLHDGVPTVATFAGYQGPPLVQDKKTGKLYWLAPGDVVTDISTGGSSGATVNAGTATLDFGASPSSEASVSVTGQTGITPSSRVKAWVMRKSTATNTTSDHEFAATAMRLSVGQPTSGVGFTIYAHCLIGFASGQFSVEWEWV